MFTETVSEMASVPIVCHVTAIVDRSLILSPVHRAVLISCFPAFSQEPAKFAVPRAHG